MAVQRFTLAKVGGPSAEAVVAVLRSAIAQRVSPDEEGSSWPREVQQLVHSMLDAIDGNATEPPVLFWCTWIDPWLAGGHFVDWSRAAGGDGEVLCAGVQDVAFAPEEHFGQLRDFAVRSEQAGQYRENQLLGRLTIEALEAYAEAQPAVVSCGDELTDHLARTRKFLQSASRWPSGSSRQFQRA